MVAPTYAEYQFFILRIENYTTPGLYEKVCGLTSRGLIKTNNFNEEELPGDCDDESIIDNTITVRSRQATVDAAGKYTRNAEPRIRQFFNDSSQNIPTNIQIEHPSPASGDIQFDQGPAYLETWEVLGEFDSKVDASMAIRFTTFPTEIPMP